MAENDTFYGALASVVLDSQPSLGTISNWDGLGGFTYVPDYHAYGEDSFTYHDVDQYGQTSNEGTVTIDVTETAPVAADVNYNVLHDQELTVPPNGVLSNSSDPDPPDMGYLTAVLFSEPSQGTLSDYVDGGGTDHPLLVDGSFAYTPPSKWAGTVTFQFKVSDGILSSALPATATIDVTDQAPVASDPGPYYVGAVDAGQTPNTLTVDAPGVLQNASDADGDKMTAQLVSGPSNGTLTLNQDGSFKYTPNAGFSGTDTFSFVASDGIKKCAPVKTNVYVVRGDLQAATIQNNAVSGTLDRSIEETVGAYVPLDNVDQDYDGTADYLEKGPIAGEKDLLPITLKAVVPAAAGGTYSLTIPSDVNVFLSPDKTGQISSAMPLLTAPDTKLYVEGIGVGSAMLVLNWTKGVHTLETDKVKVNVFDWEGPQNVPGTGIYTYTASGGGSGSTWLDPVGGTEYCDAANLQQIQWSAGPTVGQALYQASPNYIWGRDVNVVAVTIGASRLYYEDWLVQAGADDNLITPKDIPGMDGMNADLTIDSIIGPVVEGQMRGVKFMQVGAIQNVAVTADHGGFSGFDPARERVSSLEGSLLLDNSGDVPGPWYYESTLIQNLPDQAVDSIPLHVGDSPALPFSDVPVLSGGGNVDVPVDSASIVADFMLYIAAATIDTGNNAQLVFAQLAKAHWEFDGSGTVTGAGVGTFGTWTGTNEENSISGDDTFAPVTTGATVPVTTGPMANKVLSSAKWTTDPPF